MHRHSKQRKLILEVLRKSKEHPSADWVYREVKREMPGISLGTVYRNLKLLQDIGEITEISCDGNEGRFDGNPHLHYHVTCGKCGKIKDVDNIILHDLEEKVGASTGFKITNHCVGFAGICNECGHDTH